MATVTRSVKAPSGGTSWVTGDTISQASLEGDFIGIINQVNGNLDATNIAAGAIGQSELANNAVTDAAVDAAAAIQVSKLAQTAGQLDMDIVDDLWASTAESITASDPGTQDSPSAATNLEQELFRMRYVIRRACLGAGTLRTAGLVPAGWYDGCAVGPNLLVNGSFLDVSAAGAAPFGWALVGTPNAFGVLNLSGALRAEGIGNGINVVDAAGTGGAANEGFQQTVVGLKASTLYLVEARVRPSTSVVKLVTTGAAAGTFDDLAIVSGSGTGNWETLAGLIWTDATPTNIVVQLLSNATDYNWSVSMVTLREVVSPAASATNEHEGTTSRGGNLVRQATSARDGTITAQTANVNADTVINFNVPGPGYQIVVHAEASLGVPENEGVTFEIQENINSGGWTTVASRHVRAGGGGTTFTEVSSHLMFARGADATNTITPGNTYQYRLSATSATPGTTFWHAASVATDLHRIVGQMIRTGE